MYTLHLAIELPDGHFFASYGQYSVPVLPGNLNISATETEDQPVVINISGFPTEQDAMAFLKPLRACLRWAALVGEHGIAPVGGEEATSATVSFNGRVPSVSATQKKILPHFISMSAKHGQHLSVLSQKLGEAMKKGVPAKLQGQPELALALDLFSEIEFVGTAPSQFMMLFTALEVLETKATEKRGATVKRVKDALSKAAHVNPKGIGNRLDDLYKVRNRLIHNGAIVTDAQVTELKGIVRETFKALLA